MEILAKDPGVTDELQELYILSRHWISDIQFSEDEIRFLKKVVKIYLLPSFCNGYVKEIEHFNKMLSSQAAYIPHLKNKVLELLKFISPMITKPDIKIGVDLLEKFVDIENEIKALSDTVRHTRRSLFVVTERVMKSECSVFLNQLNQLKQA